MHNYAHYYIITHVIKNQNPHATKHEITHGLFQNPNYTCYIHNHASYIKIKNDTRLNLLLAYLRTIRYYCILHFLYTYIYREREREGEREITNTCCFSRTKYNKNALP
ncbi:hypothetical protein Hanom_Chr13g01237241 [Helianthus anomalus]